MDYIAYLTNEFKSPGAVLNYLSSALTWILMLGGSAAGFDTYSVSLVKHGVSKSADYSPTRALPLKPEDIINILNLFYSAGSGAHVMRVATLIGYFSFFRQSNLLPSSDGITVQVHSTKTTWGPRNSF